jgi:hypothetical protein
MAELVEHGAIPVDLLGIGLLVRNLDPVAARHVAGMRRTDADVGPGRRNQRLGLRYRLAIAQRRAVLRIELVGQALALRDVEHREALEEGDLPPLLALTRRAAVILRRELVGIADARPALALAHMAAQRLRLLEGKPALRGKTVLEQCMPQDQDIDSRIGAPAAGVARQPGNGDAAVPRLHPW